ncbi:ABC transporter substrate-binding protein [Paenibacillus sp. HB172176]|uniref:ABC transporter substrate-binding protein n=1 Tax=Paenibacillus sp. HB172176 TaxID=2493690 RepID=UPI001439758B|nr:ABC transporter substrate-binding protein [Paenibacillus sp. HB172176]
MKGSMKKVLASALLVMMVAALAACGGNKNETNNANSGANGEQATAAPAPTKLTLGYLSVMDDAQTILAYKAGLYEEYGLDVDMKVFQSGTDLIKAMVGGQVDGGVLGFTNALSWLSKGSDLKIVGGAQIGYHSLLVGSDSGIDTVSQLKGKSIASQKQGSTADIVWNGEVLASGNLTKQDVTMQYVSPAVAIQSLAAGKVDGAFVFEPYASIARLSYPVKEIYEIGEQWPFPCMVVITTGDLVKNHRDAVDKMLDAQKEAIEMLQNDPAKAASFITEEFIKEPTLKKLDGSEVPSEQVIQSAIESQTFEWALSDSDISRMDEITQFMVDQEILKEKIDVHDALDLTWQEQQK